MSDAPKRKKLEKTTEPCVASGVQRFYCCRCGTAYSRQKGYFAVSHSPMYRGSGYLPMCNECVEELYEKYRMSLGGDKEAMRRICMKFDLYWNEGIYSMVEKTVGVQSRVRNYIGKTNIIRYIDKTFDDTLAEESAQGANQRPDTFTFMEPAYEGTIGDDEIVTEQRVVDFWGAGFTPDFYTELERRYNDWTNGVNVVDPSKRSLYKQICLLEATINRDSAQGRAIDKNVNVLNTLLGSMNLKPAQKREEADAATDGTPFGVWIRRWETARPIPEPDPDLQDVDGIVRYVSVWFLGHLCKMLGIKNTYCKLYEDEIAKMRIERPEYEDEDDEVMFNDIFSSDCKAGELE